MKGYVLVTGGTGYIGSHTVVELLNKNFNVVIVDNLCNSKELVVDRIEEITRKRPIFIKLDVRDEEGLDKVFKQYKISSVIHFAGLKSVEESVRKPKLYFDNNVESAKVLVKVMRKHNVKNIVFSSSATVYGQPKRVPIYENDPLGKPANPYAETKLTIEKLLMDVYKKDSTMNIALLRYFNPIGAHSSGLIGEDPNDIPNNLMPYITQVAVKRLDYLKVYGNDYNTPDGTGIRDYIHVVDLAVGHLVTLKKLDENPGLVIYNLGTGVGTSVLELVHTFEKVNSIKIPCKIKPRRPGDIDVCYANCDKAFKEMGWKSLYNIEDCCKDSWNWQKNNPYGYN